MLSQCRIIKSTQKGGNKTHIREWKDCDEWLREQARGCKKAGSRSRNNNRTKMYTIYN